MFLPKADFEKLPKNFETQKIEGKTLGKQQNANKEKNVYNQQSV